MSERPDLDKHLARADATIDARHRHEIDDVDGANDRMLLRLRRVEEQLSESEQRFRALVEAGSQLVWETDPDGEVRFESPSWHHSTDQAAGESLGRGWLDAIHPEDRPKFDARWHAALRDAEKFTAELRLRGEDGCWRWTQISAAPIRGASGKVEKWVGMNTDITERKNSENQLRENEQRLRIAVQAIDGVFYEFDLRTQLVTRSAGLLAVTGHDPRQVPPHASWWWNQVHPEDHQRRDREFQRALKEGDHYKCEYRVRHLDGRWIHVRDQALIVRDEEGRPLKSFGCAVDITDQKEFEDNLQRARERAEAANRARGEFLANMSHEIRTPMTAILGHADILSDHLEDPDNLQCVETIRRNGRFLLEIINDILDLAKVDAGALTTVREPVRPDVLVRDVLSLMSGRAAEKGLPLVVEFETPVPEFIETDGVRLRQILLNLLSNAIKFTSRGSVRLHVRYLHEGYTLEFAVIDTGVGIQADEREHLFEPFTQADTSTTREFGGAGLGLAISRRLARALGGDIAVKSEPGVGSAFTLEIPCGERSRQELKVLWPEKRSLIEHEDETTSPRISGTVLAVDDRRDILFLAERLIEKAEGHVLTASNGLQAIEMMERWTPEDCPVDLILMDMQMPQMDGYEASRQLRARGFQGPIIAMTAHAMAGDREECLKAGCTDYVSKPLDGNTLIRMVSRYIEQQRRSPSGESSTQPRRAGFRGEENGDGKMPPEATRTHPRGASP